MLGEYIGSGRLDAAVLVWFIVILVAYGVLVGSAAMVSMLLLGWVMFIFGQPSLISPVPGVAPDDSMDDPRGGGRLHKGTDVVGQRGSTAVAPISGRVEKSGDDGGNGGNRIWIKGMDGRYHYLAHFDNLLVNEGQWVNSGDPIGTVGTTGDAAGGTPHVHYSINTSVGAEDAIGNPAQELNPEYARKWRSRFGLTGVGSSFGWGRALMATFFLALATVVADLLLVPAIELAWGAYTFNISMFFAGFAEWLGNFPRIVAMFALILVGLMPVLGVVLLVCRIKGVPLANVLRRK